MLEGAFDLKSILKQSFNAEFVYMISNCMFEPLLSSEVPDKNQVPKMTKQQISFQSDKHAFMPDYLEIEKVIEGREKLQKNIYSEVSSKRSLINQAKAR